MKNHWICERTQGLKKVSDSLSAAVIDEITAKLIPIKTKMGIKTLKFIREKKRCDHIILLQKE